MLFYLHNLDLPSFLPPCFLSCFITVYFRNYDTHFFYGKQDSHLKYIHFYVLGKHQFPMQKNNVGFFAI